MALQIGPFSAAGGGRGGLGSSVPDLCVRFEMLHAARDTAKWARRLAGSAAINRLGAGLCQHAEADYSEWRPANQPPPPAAPSPVIEIG